MTKPPSLVWRFMRNVNRKSIGFGTARRPGPPVLFVITTGRKSGLPRTTPLQYEEIDGALHIASARGRNADWVKNIEKNPDVAVDWNGRRFPARAEIVSEPARIADFLETRLKRHPVMMRLMLPFQGVSPFPSRGGLEKAARGITMVVLRETDPVGSNTAG
jgi:deazaflavin-dependent oxidoreductase (nitroreductase family)